MCELCEDPLFWQLFSHCHECPHCVKQHEGISRVTLPTIFTVYDTLQVSSQLRTVQHRTNSSNSVRTFPHHMQLTTPQRTTLCHFTIPLASPSWGVWAHTSPACPPSDTQFQNNPHQPCAGSYRRARMRVYTNASLMHCAYQHPTC